MESQRRMAARLRYRYRRRGRLLSLIAVIAASVVIVASLVQAGPEVLVHGQAFALQALALVAAAWLMPRLGARLFWQRHVRRHFEEWG